jgi:hypothetical protein
MKKMSFQSLTALLQGSSPPSDKVIKSPSAGTHANGSNHAWRMLVFTTSADRLLHEQADIQPTSPERDQGAQTQMQIKW